MKKNVLLLIAVLILGTSCSSTTPEQLAKDACDCFQDAKKINNSDSQIEKIQKCYGVFSDKMNTLRQIEKNEDMTDIQVQAFEKRFDNVYDKCK